MTKHTPASQNSDTFQSFSEFYPFYLGEHANPICRILHYSGSISALTILIYAISSGHYWLILAALIAGYGQAWIGHFFFEHNRPATFQYPRWSFIGDWVMLWDFLRGRLKQKIPDA